HEQPFGPSSCGRQRRRRKSQQEHQTGRKTSGSPQYHTRYVHTPHNSKPPTPHAQHSAPITTAVVDNTLYTSHNVLSANIHTGGHPRPPASPPVFGRRTPRPRLREGP
ncbi:unnamed protein product, partial [Ectocarpus sp. 4 AP-2014]